MLSYSTEVAVLKVDMGTFLGFPLEMFSSIIWYQKQGFVTHLLFFVRRTCKMQPFLFWPTNKMWRAPWQRQRFPSASHLTPSPHTPGMFKPAAPWQEKGESQWRTSHSLFLSAVIIVCESILKMTDTIYSNMSLQTSTGLQDLHVLKVFSFPLPPSLPASLDWMKSHVVANWKALQGIAIPQTVPSALQRPQWHLWQRLPCNTYSMSYSAVWESAESCTTSGWASEWHLDDLRVGNVHHPNTSKIGLQVMLVLFKISLLVWLYCNNLVNW